MREDFAVFILTHGRADRVKTVNTLLKRGYTGKWYIVLDNEDDSVGEYKKLYGDNVIVFDKLAISKTFDTADLAGDRRTIVYARNASFEIAKQLGLTYFLELDDDYTTFHFRKVKDNKFIQVECKQLDRLFEDMLQFLDASGALTVALAQGGDFIGGKDNANFKKGLLRKAMNTFFCRVDRPFQFVGRVNEDVNTYVNLGMRGELLFTFTKASIVQVSTQSSKGGMADMYLDSGTFAKSFYTVMYSPSSVTVAKMGSKHARLHHRINWNATTPLILSDRHKKGGRDEWR